MTKKYYPPMRADWDETEFFNTEIKPKMDELSQLCKEKNILLFAFIVSAECTAEGSLLVQIDANTGTRSALSAARIRRVCEALGAPQFPIVLPAETIAEDICKKGIDVDDSKEPAHTEKKGE